MKVLLTLLLGMFLCVYLGGRSIDIATHRFRIFLISALMSCIVFVQIMFFTKPPVIDYWSTGWFWTIKNINEQFRQRGVPLFVPLPE
jgi:hypothetical protein